MIGIFGVVVGCVVQCTDSWDTFFVDAVDDGLEAA